MSTNVYLHLDACPHCGRSDGEGLHVGKSSAGFHGYLTGDLSLPDWWDGPIATRRDWLRFAAAAIDRGARWSDDNGNDLADPDTTITGALARVGPGESQASYFRTHASPGVGFVLFTRVDPADLPGVGHPRSDRLWWVSDGYTFSTGAWS